MPVTPKKDDLDVRLSVTETKVTNIEEDLVEQKVVLRDISVKVDGLKERFDKMNGTLPHIQETCNSIERHLEGVTEANHSQETKIAKNGVSIKVMWGILVPVVIGIAGALIKIFFS